MSHMPKRFDQRAELKKIIRYFEKSLEARESDPTYPFPTINGALADGVTTASKASISQWRLKHTDLDQRLRDLIEEGPHKDSGKAQKKSPPGMTYEEVHKTLKAIDDAGDHRDHVLQEFHKSGLLDKLKKFIEKADISEEWHVRELNKTLATLTKGWPKDVQGKFSLDHSHEHTYKIVSELAAMTPEELAEYERDAVREINEINEAETQARGLKPAEPVVIEAEAHDAVPAG